MDLEAYPDCFLLQIKSSLFVSFFGKTIDKLREEGELTKIIQDIYLFHHLPESEVEKIVRGVKLETFNKNEEIIKENTLGEKMFIIKTGEVYFFKSDTFLRGLSTGAFFGEGALITKEMRSATAIAGSGVVKCYSIQAEDFSRYILNNQKLKNYLLKLMKRKQYDIHLNDLLIITKIGIGTYGSVYLVRNRKTKELFAIKVISKRLMDMDEIHPCILNEKKFLTQIDHPFIVKVINGLKDENFVYLLMEYCSGLNMLDIIRTKMKLEMVKFYIACLLIALDYIHNKKIIHRDVKPENIMVNIDVKTKLINV